MTTPSSHSKPRNIRRERRTCLRHDCRQLIHFRPWLARHGAFNLAEVLNISLGGIRFVAEGDLSVGRCLGIRLWPSAQCPETGLLPVLVRHVFEATPGVWIVSAQFGIRPTAEQLHQLVRPEGSADERVLSHQPQSPLAYANNSPARRDRRRSVTAAFLRQPGSR